MTAHDGLGLRPRPGLERVNTDGLILNEDEEDRLVEQARARGRGREHEEG